MLKRSAVCAFFSLGIASTASAQWGSSAPQGTIPAQPKVVWTEDPAHAASVSWTTADEGVSVLRYGTSPGQYPDQVTCRSVSPRFSRHYVHHCRLSNLPANTNIYLQMDTAGSTIPELYFKTAPDTDVPFKLLVGGDSRSDSSQRRVMNQVMSTLLAAQPDIIALAHGGDYIESGLRWSQWQSWLTDHELTIAGNRLLPVIPVRGNHEATGSLYDDIWDEPGVTDDNYFTTTIGKFVMITLNTNISTGGDQRNYLEQELIRVTPTARWITAHYHRPAYPAVKTPGRALQNWVPLFELYNADLVFESDGHALKRTVPIRNGMLDPTGVVYVGEGGLGVGQRTPETGRWYLAAPGQTQAAHHVQLVSVAQDRLLYEAIGDDGVVIDTWQRAPQRQIPTSGPDAGVADSGPTVPDAGPDAGPPDVGPPDLGAVLDAGPPPVDAGPPAVDAGPPAVDAGPSADAGPSVDAGAAVVDLGPPPPVQKGSDCESTPNGAFVGLLLLGLVVRRRRRN